MSEPLPDSPSTKICSAASPRGARRAALRAGSSARRAQHGGARHRPATLHQQTPSVAVGIVGSELVVADTPMHKVSATMTELHPKLKDAKVERIAFERGVTQDELVALMQNLSRLGGKAATREGSVEPPRSGRTPDGGRRTQGRHRQRHRGDPPDVLERGRRRRGRVGERGDRGHPDAPAALRTVEGLADAVTQNRTALMALTAMRSYDNYTFTHMVNVSILTMAQARALGIEGKLLREFGMSALMHDIGKVRTPKEILNKPEKLTDDEFVIMRRHVVDGAEILRRTPEMPILAPVVAFEHHLRLDGSGYPFTVKRESLNLGSMMCAIADVYDAMRSQRAYQQAYPTDRILAVLKRNDGAQMDQHLVRRFVQLLGIYPPGNLVKLSTGETAVVLRVHAPDPHRPRVRVPVRGRRHARRPAVRAQLVGAADRSGRRPARERRRAGGRGGARHRSSYVPGNRVSEALRTVLIGFARSRPGSRGSRCGRPSLPSSTPQRLIDELRLAQFAALLLTLTAGAYIGFAVVRENEPGVGLDVAFAIGFLIATGTSMIKEPRQALTILALAFAAHAVLDVAHRPGLLPDALAPRWYSIGCAVYDVYIGALCYLPVLRR
jgi:putative nucleotidyltransferase with HDIG domain